MKPGSNKKSICMISLLLFATIVEAQSEKWENVGRTDMAKVFEQMKEKEDYRKYLELKEKYDTK